MVCPACGGKTVCADSREVPENRRRRRYRCVTCPVRFTTLEEIVGIQNMDLLQRDRKPIRTHDQMRAQKILDGVRDAILKAIDDARAT